MQSKQLAANLLLFDAEVKKGVKQAELLARAKDLGFSMVEVRREYFQDITAEIPEVKAQATALDLKLFYSVPDELFVAGKVNPKLTGYFEEGQQLGIEKIKFNIGDFANYQGELQRDFAPFLNQGIEVNIENDQTQTSGTLTPILTFLKAAVAADVDIRYVYDLGNWPFVGEDFLAGAKALAVYTRYIHVKDVTEKEGQPFVQPLDEGHIDWRQALAVLPKDVPVALEYPTDNDALIKAGLQKLLAL
ncbi:sugar phosphate isomerase/epimerase family protein [Agrilactobacillus fermenti]|uniref:sugar phosphate isomerase/epimerase family protein n=1 Tax=Agrilactobacillus fermenti TaxID=2586909 RepID=UPI003A5BEEA1